MLYPSFARLFAALCTLSYVVASPLEPPLSGLDNQARRILERATPASPHFVVYSDKFVSGTTGPPAASAVAGFNVFALSFLLTEGPFDKAEEWTQLTAAERSSVKSQYAAAGISLIVSVFGSTDVPTSSGADPIATANTVAAWVIQYDLDGVDVDYEDFNAIDAGDGKAEAWLVSFTTQLRSSLPQGQYILTHAPVAPWFSPGKFGGGAYLTVDQKVGSLIDWYNIQFYNQGTSEYTTCDGLLTTSSSTWPQSALFQIAASGVSLDKLVIGKPGTTGDANNGYIDPSTLAGCLGQAKSQGWTGGAMVWEFPDAAASWIATVRSDSWPVSGSTGTTTTTSPTSTPTSGSCSGVAAWDSSAVYTGGMQATYNGDLWTAKWWTEDDVPGGAAGVWTDDGPCASLKKAVQKATSQPSKATASASARAKSSR
ncbi:carbohydrate-binding module family 5 protein [Plicaturopsis crispa FD-325 SS-3]|nr:carbohydrate-binding module family 5 protein [Plicaturopsis crispa FD-325 SS-3]